MVSLGLFGALVVVVALQLPSSICFSLASRAAIFADVLHVGGSQRSTVKPAYCDHLWARNVALNNRGSLFRELLLGEMWP